MVKQQSLKIIALITRLNRPALRFTTWSGRHLLHNHLTEGEEGRKKGGRRLGKKRRKEQVRDSNHMRMFTWKRSHVDCAVGKETASCGYYLRMNSIRGMRSSMESERDREDTEGSLPNCGLASMIPSSER